MFRKSVSVKLLVLVLVLILAAGMSACSEDSGARRAENEEKLIKAMTEYPGDGLYDPVVTVIGIDAPEPTEEERAEAEQKAAEEKDAWEAAVGDCFAEGMFDTFYGKWYRTEVLGVAMSKELTTTLTSFEVAEDNDKSDNIEHALATVTAADADGEEKTYEMDWMVTFDKDDPALIQRIELTDDGGLWEEYQDKGSELSSGLTVVEDEENGTRTLDTDYFTLTLGNYKTWWYEINESGGITIFNTAARDEGLGGRVMSVEVWNEPDTEPYDGMIPYKEIGTVYNHRIIVTYASDVQYDFNDEAEAADYMAVRNEAEKITEGGTEGPLILK